MTDTTAGSAGIGARFSVAYVWIAVLIFASANSIVLLLFQLGAENPVMGRNPISFCNVLFVGNLVATTTLYIVYRKQWNRDAIGKLSRADWTSIVFLAVLTGAVSPAVIFLALENTTVTNVILIGRIEPFVLLGLSFVVLKERSDFWSVLGAVICFIGVVVAFALEATVSGLNFGKGELWAALGAVLAAVGIVVSKVRLQSIPLGIFTVARTGLGAVVFFFVVLYLFDWEHFIDVFSPFLWQWMLVYGALIVVGGQFFWFTGIKNARTSDVSLASSFTPIAGVLFAFLLLGERPGAPILIGGAVIVLGIAVGQYGKWIAQQREKKAKMSMSDTLECEGQVNFKGV